MTMTLRPTRRVFLRGGATVGAGLAAGGFGSLVSSLLGPGRAGAATHHAPRARRVVQLFMSGGPSQLETFDHKPGLAAVDGRPLPDSVRNGQLLTTMSPQTGPLPVVAPRFSFAQHGASGAWVSELLPNIAEIVDEITIIRTMRTDQINHDPAIMMMQTGSPLPGRPTFGAWMSYALGTTNEDLPPYSVLLSTADTGGTGQPLSSAYWGSGFLPAEHQGVRFSGGPEPVLYLEDGARLPMASRTRLRDTRRALDELHHARTGHDDLLARIEANELALNMQTAVPELAALASEPASTFALYGEEARTPGTFAANCVLARRMLERDATFVQLFHRDWDHHQTMQTDHPWQARAVDRASAALVRDLRDRGMLDDTLVIWGGEFGRTVYAQGASASQYGRDHHPRCFSIWVAGGGIKRGYVHGETDDYSYNVVSGGVHVHDLHATLLHLLGFDHTRLTYRAEGRDFRLTDVFGNVVSNLLT
jgi:uncharacterized protein (DUF1501 family)